jgi:hypothetical protein
MGARCPSAASTDIERFVSQVLKRCQAHESLVASAMQILGANADPKRNSSFKPPEGKPRQSGPRSSQPMTIPVSLPCFAYTLPNGPSRGMP